MPRISKNALAKLENGVQTARRSASNARAKAAEAPASAGLVQFGTTLAGGLTAGTANARMDNFMGADPSTAVGLVATGAALACYFAGVPGMNACLGFAGGNLAASAANWAEERAMAAPAAVAAK